MIIFDIETGPLPEQDLRDRMPVFEAPSNWKDADKIAANIAEKREKWFADAALDATTGCVEAVGFLDTGTDLMEILHGDEREVLVRFWRKVWDASNSSERVVGWNSNGFDLPFLVRRSWIHKVEIPIWVRRGRNWDVCFVDLMECWALGVREDRESLGDAASALGVGRKSGSGADFSRLFRDVETRAQAIAYLENDLRLTAKMAERMGIA